MADDDAAKMLGELIERCDRSARNAQVRGRRYHIFGYALMIVSVAGSIGAGVMALWSEAVPRQWIGTVALLPALCATIATQLRLTEKENFSYRRYRALDALARRAEIARMRAPTLDTLETFSAEEAELKRLLDETWVEGLNFNFTAAGRIERA
jgi:hypothetical protein